VVSNKPGPVTSHLIEDGDVEVPAHIFTGHCVFEVGDHLAFYSTNSENDGGVKIGYFRIDPREQEGFSKEDNDDSGEFDPTRPWHIDEAIRDYAARVVDITVPDLNANGPTWQCRLYTLVEMIAKIIDETEEADDRPLEEVDAPEPVEVDPTVRANALGLRVVAGVDTCQHLNASWKGGVCTVKGNEACGYLQGHQGDCELSGKTRREITGQ
jgi:hypothetical protein